MTSRLTLPAVAAAAALFFAGDAGAQARSDIKADPKSSSCTENCIDAGYEWAIANKPAQDAECMAANEDFAAGCAHWLEEQREAAAPPLETPVATDASGTAEDVGTEVPGAPPPAADAASPAPSPDSATSTQVDDSAAPPSDAPASPPSGQ